MGLRPLPSGRTETVVVGDSTYNMREMVNLAEIERSRLLRMESFAWVERAQNMRDSFAAGGTVQLADIRQAIEQGNQAMRDLVLIWLESWSHPDAIDRTSVARLESDDIDAIAKYISDKLRRGDDDAANPTQ